MTTEEFIKTSFHKGMKAEWNKSIYNIVGVDFEDEQIEIWLYCENMTKWVNIEYITIKF